MEKHMTTAAGVVFACSFCFPFPPPSNQLRIAHSLRSSRTKIRRNKTFGRFKATASLCVLQHFLLDDPGSTLLLVVAKTLEGYIIGWVGRTWSHPISPDCLPSSHPKNIAVFAVWDCPAVSTGRGFCNFLLRSCHSDSRKESFVQASNCGVSMLSFWSTNFFRTWWMRIFDWKSSMHTKYTQTYKGETADWTCMASRWCSGCNMSRTSAQYKHAAVMHWFRQASIPWPSPTTQVEAFPMCRGNARVTLLLIWRIRLGKWIRDDSWRRRQHSWPLLPASWEIRFDGPLFHWQHPVHSAGSSCTMQMFGYWWQIAWLLDPLWRDGVLATFHDHEIIGMSRWDMMSITLSQAHSAFKACRHLQSNGSACPPCQRFRKCPSETLPTHTHVITRHAFSGNFTYPDCQNLWKTLFKCWHVAVELKL